MCVLSMGTDNDAYGNDPRGKTVYARLVLTDGTMVKVETDVKASDAKSESNQNPTIYDAMAMYNHHLVSYSVDKNDVYSLKDRSDAPIAKNTTLKIENGVAGMDINFNGETRYTANSNTVFVVAETDDDSYNDYDFTVYTGVKNVPDIDSRTTGTNVAVAADGKVAKVVYIEDADVAGTGEVIFVETDADAKLIKDSELGNYYEIEAVVDGQVKTLNVKQNSSADTALIADKGIVALKSVTENSDGLVTSVREYKGYDKVTGDGFIEGSSTQKAEKDTVGLDDTRYAWTDDVVVVRYDYKGDFSTSRISSIKTDGNDEFVAVLDGDVITGICILEVRGQEGNTPDEPSVVDGYKTHVSKVDGSDIFVYAVDSESKGNKQAVAIAYLNDEGYTIIQAVSNTTIKAEKDGVTYTFNIVFNEAKEITYTNNMGGEWQLKGDKYAAKGDKVTVVVSHPAWNRDDARTFNYSGAATGTTGAVTTTTGSYSFQVVISDNTQALTVTIG